jgi:AAA+ superfamily predicted ATPase
VGLMRAQHGLELDRRLGEEFARFRARIAGDGSAFVGLYVDEGEVEQLLSRLSDETWALVDEERLGALERWFGLDDFETSVVLACLAPELDPAYGRIYAFLQDDIAKRRPTVGLLLRICPGAPDDRGAARACFHASSPLARSSIVRLPEPLDGPLLDAVPRLDERIVGFLLGSDLQEARLLEHVRLEHDPRPRPLPASVTESVAAAAATSRLVALQGAGSNSDVARLYARELGHALLLVDVPSILGSTATAPAELVRLVFREANLELAAIYLDGCDELWNDANRHVLNVLRDELALWPAPCVLDGGSGWEPPATLANRIVVPLVLRPPTTGERQAAWEEALVGSTAEAAFLAGAFKLTAEQIRDAALLARALASAEGATGVERRHLSAGARALSSRRLLSLAHEIVPKAQWNDLVLPEDAVAQLSELCATVRLHAQVLEESGFGDRLSGGTGVTALFSGVSGTGKTMAAEVIARELGLPLFRIDLASVVSKWIGETEKNLDRVFAAATDSNAILFFDEADALFGKRSEVKDSHDRYANLEISFLLQKMESYDGVAILATNMRHNVDDAFLRRLTFNVVFPFPEERERARIWEAVWPPSLARADDVDFSRLARIKLVGGNIKNVILAAAHNAAVRGEPVATADLLHSIRREYQKVGKQMSVAELGRALDDEGI